MEIHAPSHPILSFKEALVHLSIVTVGILIALSFEGALEWRHHRVLVAETRERLRSELKGNQESIQTVLKALGPTKDRFIRALDLASDLSTPDKIKEAGAAFVPGGDNVVSGMSFAFFNRAAYATAEVTGALGLMEYGEALKYADAYDLQELYTRMQDAAEKELFAAAMLGQALLGKPTPTEGEDVRRQLRLAIGGLVTMENIAIKLDQLYGKALKEDAGE
jgi:hypothetical protein